MDVALGFMATRRREETGNAKEPAPVIDAGVNPGPDTTTGRDRTGPTTTISTTPVRVGAGRDCTGVRTDSKAGFTAQDSDTTDPPWEPPVLPTDHRPGWIRHQLSGREMT